MVKQGKKKRERRRTQHDLAIFFTILPSLLGVHVVDQLVSLVDQGDQLLEQQLLAVLVGLAFLPL